MHGSPTNVSGFPQWLWAVWRYLSLAEALCGGRLHFHEPDTYVAIQCYQLSHSKLSLYLPGGAFHPATLLVRAYLSHMLNAVTAHFIRVHLGRYHR